MESFDYFRLSYGKQLLIQAVLEMFYWTQPAEAYLPMKQHLETILPALPFRSED